MNTQIEIIKDAQLDLQSWRTLGIQLGIAMNEYFKVKTELDDLKAKLKAITQSLD